MTKGVDKYKTCNTCGSHKMHLAPSRAARAVLVYLFTWIPTLLLGFIIGPFIIPVMIFTFLFMLISVIVFKIKGDDELLYVCPICKTKEVVHIPNGGGE